MESIGEGVPGYVTPKVAIGAIVGNDAGELLLVQRADSGIWLYPTGWADVGYSPAEVAVKEVLEETGIECVPQRLLAVIDGQRMGFSRFAMYMLVFHCSAAGGELRAHPLETSGVGWFDESSLPETTAGAGWWGPMAFAAINAGGAADDLRRSSFPCLASVTLSRRCRDRAGTSRPLQRVTSVGLFVVVADQLFQPADVVLQFVRLDELVDTRLVVGDLAVERSRRPWNAEDLTRPLEERDRRRRRRECVGVVRYRCP